MADFSLGSTVSRSWNMPDESHRHGRTWMAWGASRAIWGDLLPYVRKDLASLANTIVDFEPVSMLVPPNERRLAARMLDERIRLIESPLDDVWIRDTGPTFVLDGEGKLGGVDLNFNGWGGKQNCQRDARVARHVCQQSNAEWIESSLVGEGGGIEVDGQGTAILTESCFVNENRNSGLSKVDIESELKRLLGIRKVIWLPGLRGEDITDGHTDFYARFARPGIVVA
ncbi:MAG: agmatine deiminase family protein, partial [Planctomycetota bacterium]